MSGEASRDPEPPEVVLRKPHQGKVIEITETTIVEPDAQRLIVTYRAYVEGEQCGEETIQHDYLTRQQILSLLPRAGLTAELVLSNFEDPVPDEDGGHLIVCAAPAT
jgi:hypothetical protein